MQALGDGKTEVRRAAMKSIQRFGPQGAIFVPDIIILAEKKENCVQSKECCAGLSGQARTFVRFRN